MIIVFTLPVCTAACSLNPANPRRYPGIAPPIPAANLDEKLDILCTAFAQSLSGESCLICCVVTIKQFNNKNNGFH